MQFKTEVVGSKGLVEEVVDRYDSDVKVVFEQHDAELADRLLKYIGKVAKISEIVKRLFSPEDEAAYVKYVQSFAAFYDGHRGKDIIKLGTVGDVNRYKHSPYCAKMQRKMPKMGLNYYCFTGWCRTDKCPKKKINIRNS